MKYNKKLLTIGSVMILGVLALTGCQSQAQAAGSQVVIHSNADDEAVTAMKRALDANGYEGKYIFQTFGTSELGGKLLAEGTTIEADLVTMSSFYLESAQEEQKMFADLTFTRDTLEENPSYYTPITAQEGTVILNPKLLSDNNLKQPASIKDLADPVYKDLVSVTDIKSSSTAWLLIQALTDSYGEEEAKTILKGIYENAGVHIESSGSGPIKKIRAGEVAVGFGLRHQAVADQAAGLPVSYIDPAEGSYILTESLAVVDKGGKTNPLAMEMAECIMKYARTDLIEVYQYPLYKGEPTDGTGNAKTYPEKLTASLLKKHQELSEECK